MWHVACGMRHVARAPVMPWPAELVPAEADDGAVSYQLTSEEREAGGWVPAQLIGLGLGSELALGLGVRLRPRQISRRR